MGKVPSFVSMMDKTSFLSKEEVVSDQMDRPRASVRATGETYKAARVYYRLYQHESKRDWTGRASQCDVTMK